MSGRYELAIAPAAKSSIARSVAVALHIPWRMFPGRVSNYSFTYIIPTPNAEP